MQHPDLGRAPSLSFEFFPPHSTEATLRLWRSVERLAPLGPRFVSVTYGAGGATRDRTLAAIATIRDRARLPIAGHLTCIDATRDDTLAVARDYLRRGVRRIVALRGDPPKGQSGFVPHPDGFSGAADLVAGLRALGDFEIIVAAYPEKHPEAATMKDDIDNLKRKIGAGATSAITQFFFDSTAFLRFRDACAGAGISAPIIPGILPIENFPRLTGFAERCGAHVPNWMHASFANADTIDAQDLLATAIATEICDDLMSEGVEHLHFYTLNKPDLTYDICRAIGVETLSPALAGVGADVA